MKKIIGAMSTVIIGNDIYFHESYGNRICRYSLENQELSYIAHSDFMPGYRLGYMGTARCGDRIYFFPYYAKKICIYNTQNDSLTYRDCKYQYITKAINCGGIIYYWANEQDWIAYFDTNKETAGEIKLPDGMRTNAGCGGGMEVNGRLYIPAKEKGTVFCVDISTLSSQLLVIADEEMMFETIDFDGENFWLSGTEKKIIKWNVANNEKTSYVFDDLEDRKMDMSWDSYFFMSRIFDGYIYFSPLKAKQLIRIHIQSGKVKPVLDMGENEITMLLEVWNDVLYFSCKNIGDGMALMDCLLDKNGRVVREKILFGEQDYNYVMQEHNGKSLGNFIRQIKGGCNEERYFQ